MVYFSDSRDMSNIKDDSVHLMVTSPPYFNAKEYSKDYSGKDLGNISDIDLWFEEIGKVWREVFRVIQPGRKIFINIMNLPIKVGISFKMLNLVGKTIDNCEKIGFVFKRDIIWHKTNGVRAHFGTYPYPGGILINNMHEFILEFEKPNPKGIEKYKHLSKAIKEKSKITKDFWLSLKNTDVWLMKPEKSGNGRRHKAPYAVELPYRLIKAYSYLTETIIDPFLGSGTTFKAAATLGRNGIGYEINRDFEKIIDENLSQIQPELELI
ncbi:MAG: site-specific DNA-methyltransferase [Deltaproteobacteria bacterium]|nr:site-specific DNA-methyltransferase [Deltaproteobacteria bacterium]